MTAMPDMEFRRLEGEERELAVGLADSLAGVEDAKFEGWGLEQGADALHYCELWGVFIRGGLAGALWLTAGGGVAEIKALALPRRRWGMGLVQWLISRLTESAKKSGAATLAITLTSGGEHLGEILEESGFSGPNLAEETYPAGKWLCRLVAPAAPVNRMGGGGGMR